MIVTYKGVELVPLNEASRMIDRSVQTIRYMLSDRQARKGITHIRDGCHTYIPLAVLQGYQYGEPGVVSAVGHDVYHFIDDGTGKLRKTYCRDCTLTKEGCKLFQEAERVAAEVRNWQI